MPRAREPGAWASRASAPFALAVGLGLTTQARAERPTEGGLFAYDDADVLAVHDVDTRVRIHYSVEGPSATILEDLDSSGVPDFVELAGAMALESLDIFEGAGFRPPLFEAELGLPELGGSPAFDIYLVDFDGYGDGAFQLDGCDANGPRCAGFALVENDFAGYGYASAEVALRTLMSHELFHAVQAAYRADLATWFSEGSATWAERLVDPDSADYLRLVDHYLPRADASIYAGPQGPGAAFVYGTALWFDFLAERHAGPGIVEASLGRLALGDEAAQIEVLALDEVLLTWEDELAEAFMDFAAANLASGDLAGAFASHPYASDLVGIELEASGDEVLDEQRNYPLAASYYRLERGGAPTWMALRGIDEARLDDLGVQVFDADESGKPAFLVHRGPASEFAQCAELDTMAETSFVVLTQPDYTQGEGSIHVELCVGERATAEACGVSCENSSGSETGESDSSEGDEGTATTSEGEEESEGDGSVPPGADDPGEGCACTADSRGATPTLWFALLLGWRGRRARLSPSSDRDVRA